MKEENKASPGAVAVRKTRVGKNTGTKKSRRRHRPKGPPWKTARTAISNAAGSAKQDDDLNKICVPIPTFLEPGSAVSGKVYLFDRGGTALWGGSIEGSVKKDGTFDCAFAFLETALKGYQGSPARNFLKVEEMAERDRMLMSLYQKDVELGDDVKVLGLPKTAKAIGQWFDELEYRYNEGMLSEAEADLSHRCGEFIMRAAIPLVALEGRETREIVDFCMWVGRYAHYTMCRLYGKSTQMNIDEAAQMLNGCQDKRKTNEPLMNLLNDTFTLKQIKDLRERNGLHANVRPLLTSYIKKGKIMRLARGIYRKIPQK